MRVQPIREFEKFITIQKLLIRDKKIRECLLLQVLYNTNLRISDVLRLKWSDVIDVDGAPFDHFNLIEMKTGKKTWKPLTDQLVVAFTSYFHKYRPRRNDYIFRSESPKIKFRNVPWHRNYAYQFIKEYAKLAGITRNVGTHTPRKTWAWHYYHNGGDLEVLRLELNHSNIRTTLIYAGIEEDQRRSTYQKLSKLNSASTEMMEYDNLPERVPNYNRKKYVPPKKKYKKPEKINDYSRRMTRR